VLTKVIGRSYLCFIITTLGMLMSRNFPARIQHIMQRCYLPKLDVFLIGRPQWSFNSSLYLIMANDHVVAGSWYLYAPVKWAPPVFAFFFLAATCYHLWQCIHFKAFRVSGLHPFCALLFTIGFALRSYNAWDFANVDTYLASTMFIYFAP
jgi:hypothetical protein